MSLLVLPTVITKGRHNRRFRPEIKIVLNCKSNVYKKGRTNNSAMNFNVKIIISNPQKKTIKTDCDIYRVFQRPETTMNGIYREPTAL
jgi:hypothetical protein